MSLDCAPSPASLNPLKLSRPRVPALALSVDDAAAALALSPDSVRELVKLNKLPHVRCGRRVLLPVRGLQRWLDQEQIGLQNGGGA